MNVAQRFIVVSNRLPVTLEDGANGIEVQPSCGGLVSALLPIFRESGGVWIGWPGITDYTPRIADVLRGECAPEYSLEPVQLSAKDRALFYQGCANEIIWPLFHDLQSRCRFDPCFWRSYCDVNVKFADAVVDVANGNDIIWVHDYHLMKVGRYLRERSVSSPIAYFHHIPFPSPDIFEKIPWRRELIEDLLSFSTVGFQTDRDRRNFVACMKREISGVHIRRVHDLYEIVAGGNVTRVGTFPISIDYASFSEAARHEKIRTMCDGIKRSCDGRKIILGIDRLDYTKGIPERLLGFASLLKNHPELKNELSFIQVVVPSREDIQNYSELKDSIQRRVSEINGEYGSPDWCPITYMHKCLSAEELLALYRAADVMLVTPLKDGMNLVAKEYCAAQGDEKGVLVLSEFAGAAAELKRGALLVNPYDSEAMSSALYRALTMDGIARCRRMRQLREFIKSRDVFSWRNRFLAAVTSEPCSTEKLNVQSREETLRTFTAQAV
jgi:alpha,alpha-trehalose-phosphate synthase [UDP-forming]